MYYKPKELVGGTGDVWVSPEYDRTEYPTLDMLISPLRKPNVLDRWSPMEIALFEAGICHHGKDFHSIAKLIKTKSTTEVVDFYYMWKKSAHYQMWKEYGKPINKLHPSKQQQWLAIHDKMKQLSKKQ